MARPGEVYHDSASHLLRTGIPHLEPFAAVVAKGSFGSRRAERFPPKYNPRYPIQSRDLIQAAIDDPDFTDCSPVRSIMRSIRFGSRGACELRHSFEKHRFARCLIATTTSSLALRATAEGGYGLDLAVPIRPMASKRSTPRSADIFGSIASRGKTTCLLSGD